MSATHINPDSPEIWIFFKKDGIIECCLSYKNVHSSVKLYSLKSVLSLKTVNKQLDVPFSALRLGYAGQSQYEFRNTQPIFSGLDESSHFSFGWTLLKTVAPLCISLWTDFSCAFLSSLCVKTECWLLLYMYEGQYYRLIKVAIFKAISFSSTTLCPITLISGQINDLQ